MGSCSSSESTAETVGPSGPGGAGFRQAPCWRSARIQLREEALAAQAMLEPHSARQTIVVTDGMLDDTLREQEDPPRRDEIEAAGPSYRFDAAFLYLAPVLGPCTSPSRRSTSPGDGGGDPGKCAGPVTEMLV